MAEVGGFAVGMASTGFGINSAGHVAGSARTAADVERAFFWDGAGALTPLGTIAMGDMSIATAVNDADTVVGFGALDSFASTFGAFIWTAGGGIHQLTQLFPYETRALDINNDGDAVGWSWLDGMGNSRAVLWEGGGPIVNLNDRIPPMSGWLLQNATSINDAGQIAGVGELNGASRAFLLTPVPEPATAALAWCLLWARRAARRLLSHPC
jgi:probable HAF family extracellular repeat protein